jgi:hypothetical protein
LGSGFTLQPTPYADSCVITSGRQLTANKPDALLRAKTCKAHLFDAAGTIRRNEVYFDRSQLRSEFANVRKGT